MNIMDETYGVGKWQTSHKTRTKGDGSTEMFCEVKVFNEEIEQWLSRDDAGLGINDKIQSTDAFKRACVLWGVGTELYSLPEEKIVIDAYRPAVDSYGKPIELNGIQQNETIVNVEQDENGNYFCPDVFKITQYHLDDKYMIDGLAIKNLSTGKWFTHLFRKALKNQEKGLLTSRDTNVSFRTLANMPGLKHL